MVAGQLVRQVPARHPPRGGDVCMSGWRRYAQPRRLPDTHDGVTGADRLVTAQAPLAVDGPVISHTGLDPVCRAPRQSLSLVCNPAFPIDHDPCQTGGSDLSRRSPGRHAATPWPQPPDHLPLQVVAWGVLSGLCGSGGGGYRAAGHRQRWCWIDPYSRCLVRRRRTQTDHRGCCRPVTVLGCPSVGR